MEYNRRFRWPAVFIAAIAVLWYIVFFVVEHNAQRDFERRQNKLMIVSWAVSNYRAWGQPLVGQNEGAGDNALYSWRFKISPFCNPPTDANEPRFDEPWNSPHNTALACDLTWEPNLHDAHGFATVFIFRGPDTPFDPTTGYAENEYPPGLILLVETRQTRVHWMEPGDLNIGDIKSVPRSAGECDWWRGPFLVLFGDGAIWELSSTTPCSLIAQFATIAGATKRDREDSLGKYAVRRSRIK